MMSVQRPLTKTRYHLWQSEMELARAIEFRVIQQVREMTGSSGEPNRTLTTFDNLLGRNIDFPEWARQPTIPLKAWLTT